MVVSEEPLSTFSIDVDVASYANCRRFVNNGQLPPADAVRIEEFINYFEYEYPQPEDGRPIGATIEIAECPWNTKRLLAKIGLKGKEIENAQKPPSYLTFLIDVSGSMSSANKLPLLKEAFKLLVEQLGEQDRVAIVVYASSTGCVLPLTSANEKTRIIAAIDQLESGGSTAGGAGIQLAYSIASENYNPEANNRVILATDGDFNVGISNTDALIELIEEKRESGIYLTVLGFGMGNLKDDKMEALADHGNGNYAYIDDRAEAEKVFVHDLAKMISVVAQDVKIQVEFNPQQIKAYRLIGYENRLLESEDFNNDKKDAGEMGAGHTVTACYEIIPVASDEAVPGVDSLRYQKSSLDVPDQDVADEYLFVKIRYKLPGDSTSNLYTIPAGRQCFTESPSTDFQFVSAVVAYGLLMKRSDYCGTASFEQVISIGNEAVGSDPEGYRKDFVSLVELASRLE